MNDLRETMRARWNAKGYQYEHASAHGTKNPAEKKRWRNIAARLGPGPLDVLDVGTGTGFVALILAELGHRTTGVDWSVTMLDQARLKARDAGLEITFVEGDIELLPFAAASFDAVMARHVLWTLAEPERAIAEWYRVLRPGGRALADFSPRRPGEKGHHYPPEIEERLPLNRDVSPDEVAALFVNAGFAGVDVQILPRDPGSDRVTYLISGFRPRGV
ncbi:class I SAM-dependent methyltransferase [Desulforudis sp. 1088]|uniref:class I SAM-dependent methyltransferase n=1 Tax=unclassified Candidatus Desulforudis TaxID=2635950 RepID=UPI003CE5A009